MDMTLIGTGLYANVEQQVDPTHRAARVSIRPNEVGVYGSYRKCLKSGVIAAGLSGPLPVWEMRWGSSSVVAIVRKLKIQAVASATAFAATAADSSFSLYRAQGFSALDTTSATLAAFTKAKANNTATRMAASQLSGDATTLRTGTGGIAILTTANTGMAGGTKILDDDPIAIVLNSMLATAAAESLITPTGEAVLIDPCECPVLNPIELSQNEGLVLNCDAITGTGTWRLKVEVCWDEVDPARYFQ